MANDETGADAGADDGTTWVWIAFAPEHRLILALVAGPRTQPSADELIARTASVLVGRLPLFVSDGLDQYGTALFDRGHVEVPYPPTGKRGRPRNPDKIPLPELRYAQVVKRRKGRRIEVAYCNLVRPHLSLRQPTAPDLVDNPRARRWDKRTPAMAANLTDHVWSLRELVTSQAAQIATD